MKKNIIYIALLAVASLGFSSCDSELDIEKHGNLGSMDDFNILPTRTPCRPQLRCTPR